jgi:cysteinyl-tRNA synthetase
MFTDSTDIHSVKKNISLRDEQNDTMFELDTSIDTINWYSCGPTVHNATHMGHARTFSIIDSMRRYFKLNDLNVKFGMNITDIDDKIMTKVKELYDASDTSDVYMSHEDIYNTFIQTNIDGFWASLRSINVLPPDVTLRVSECISEIIAFIQKLIELDSAYESNGSVYFKYDSYVKTYGMCLLAPLSSDDNDVSIKDTYLHEKVNTKDFALWKSEKNGWISFDSPWGKGTPGWHIECSVMSNMMFEDTIHLHSGGIDLKFPHHHNEVLQSNSYHCKCDVFKHFIYVGHLTSNGIKLSQSLNNFITLDDFVKDHGANVTRLLFLMSKWDNPAELSEDCVMQAHALNERLHNFANELQHHIKIMRKFETDVKDGNVVPPYDDVTGIRIPLVSPNPWLEGDINSFVIQYKNALDTNFNTTEFIMVITEFINKIYSYIEHKMGMTQRQTMPVSQLERIVSIFDDVFNIMGVTYDTSSNKYIDVITDIRNEMRTIIMDKSYNQKELIKKLFKLSDDIRDKYVPSFGYSMQDTPRGIKTLPLLKTFK